MSGHFLTKITHQYPKSVVIAVVIVPILLLVLLLQAAGAGQATAAPKEAQLQQVELLQVKRQESYQRQVNIIGRAEAGEQTILGFELAGTLANILIEEGQAVLKGQLLASLDMQRLEAQRDEAAAAVARAKADERIAQLSEQRIKQLVKDKLESPQRLDEARESTRAASALVAETEARLQRVNVEFEKSKLYAPFNGIVVSRMLDNGAIVAQGQGVFELLSSDLLHVRMSLSADDAFRFSRGQIHTLLKGQQQYQAEVISVGAQRNIQTRTIDVMFLLPSKYQGQVLQGDLLILPLHKRIEEPGFWLPKSALTSSIRGLWSVFSVPQPGDNQQLRSRNVTVLYGDAQRVFVSGPIADNEYVVASGVHRLVPEQYVSAQINADALYAGTDNE